MLHEVICDFYDLAMCSYLHFPLSNIWPNNFYTNTDPRAKPLIYGITNVSGIQNNLYYTLDAVLSLWFCLSCDGRRVRKPDLAYP